MNHVEREELATSFRDAIQQVVICYGSLPIASDRSRIMVNKLLDCYDMLDGKLPPQYWRDIASDAEDINAMFKKEYPDDQTPSAFISRAAIVHAQREGIRMVAIVLGIETNQLTHLIAPYFDGMSFIDPDLLSIRALRRQFTRSVNRSTIKARGYHA